MDTWQVHIEGQVQGVGFRPFVFLLARKYGLKGWVNNRVDGVHVVFNADEKCAQEFMDQIVEQAPVLSKITSIQRGKISQKFFDNFQIIHSKEEGSPQLLLTPDFALCQDCSRELEEKQDRRYAYPFITCTNCGPRYSIIHQLPYDRVNTKMDRFQMCPSCRKEYDDPLDRRYYSQTNSCPDCAIELSLYDDKGNQISIQAAQMIDQVVRFWEEGKIVAIKGIGGYLLTCNASDRAAISRLRKRKHRPSKPFALMYPDLASMSELGLEQKAIEILKSHIAPIVLAEVKQRGEAFDEIAPGLNEVGVMLPYTPLYQQLLKTFGKAIVATSGNISKAPIVYEEEKALKELAQIADFILTNNRAIVVPQDDSVVKYSPFKKQKIILRRSRGLAPTYINADLKWPSTSVLAMGAMLKSTFSLLHSGNTYISQYLGDLEQFDTQQSYYRTINHFLQLFNTQADAILIDQHSDYPSSQYGKHLATKWKIPIESIQHHKAHFCAVIGEHNLIHSESPVLGVIWDGTGLGDDGQIWGGEFFKYEQYDFQRCNRFDYFDFILGDKMPKEPRISALSACWEIEAAAVLLKEKFSATEWKIYSRLLEKKSRLQTSSVGRIFDAVAALLGLMDQQTYEGEAAMQLEAIASRYFKAHGWEDNMTYLEEGVDCHPIPTQTLMTRIVMDLQNGVAKDCIAARFHLSLVQSIRMVANHLKIKKIAFSGGVFQNGLLVDLIQHHLNEDFELYFHQELSPNDENISFGQLVGYQIKKYQESFIKNKSNKHVFSNSRQN